MRRLILFTLGLLLAVTAAAETPAILERNDGRAWRLFLKGRDSQYVTVRLDKAARDSRYELKDIRLLTFTGVSFDPQRLEQQFNAADYPAVIQTLEPQLNGCRPYASIRNNMEQAFLTLLKAYCRGADWASAARLAEDLRESPNPDLARASRIATARSAIGQGDVLTAEDLIGQLDDVPAAQLYLRACLQQAQGRPKEAVRTAVRLIAEHGNDMNWMPQTELLCARLYLELDLPESAAAAARQAAVFYEGTNIGAEAAALHAELKETLTAQPE